MLVVMLGLEAALAAPFPRRAGASATIFAVEHGRIPLLVETTLPQHGRLVKAPALVSMHYSCVASCDDCKSALNRFYGQVPKKSSVSWRGFDSSRCFEGC